MDELPREALEQAAAAVLVGHLSSEEAGYITGATLDVNGGVFMR